MKKILKLTIKIIFAYTFCGGLYLFLEILFRGRTYLEMYFLAGFLGIFAMFFNNIYSYDTDYLVQILSVSLFSTYCEGLFGNIINKDYHIWDYRKLPFSFWNDQVNAIFFLFWCLIVTIIIPILDYIDWKLFDYKKDTPPYYKILGRVFYQFKE